MRTSGPLVAAVGAGVTVAGLGGAGVAGAATVARGGLGDATTGVLEPAHLASPMTSTNWNV